MEKQGEQALTDRGICNAWFWPLDGARHCLPWRPIPLRGAPLFGLERLVWELQWIGVPLGLLALAGPLWRRWRATGPAHAGVPVCAGAMPPGQDDRPRAQRQRRRQAVQALAAGLLAPRARANMRP
ncbi:hypothetical protein [Hydrogenophaga sp.]|uniref:hypothetical protein n=1 Tax=Hydrogenophaga sp. TaxID=1904254 RepID=UPI00286D7A9D|nr:hypothetical protein [Hydrogenophaga sp.]